MSTLPPRSATAVQIVMPPACAPLVQDQTETQAVSRIVRLLTILNLNEWQSN